MATSSGISSGDTSKHLLIIILTWFDIQANLISVYLKKCNIMALEYQPLDSKKYKSLLHYYKSKKLKTSFRNLGFDNRFTQYESQRKHFFETKLGIPVQTFGQQKLIEFGPECGENSLCFAHWGALLTLVEPNLSCHIKIKEYFRNFDYEDKLRGLSAELIEHYKTDQQYDIVDAEGFLASIRPMEQWLSLINSLLRINGIFIVSYFERHGAFSERYLSVLCKTLLANSDSQGLTHKKIFSKLVKTKWDGVNSLRSLNTWYQDHIENPFSSSNYQIDGRDLISKASKQHLTLHASFPNYLDKLWVGWSKNFFASSSLVDQTLEFFNRSRLSFIVGKKCFFTGSCEELRLFNESIDYLLKSLATLDCSVDKMSTETLQHSMTELLSFLQNNSDKFFAEDLSKQIDGIELLIDCLANAENGNVDKISCLLRRDSWFNEFWGTPVHFCVFRREGHE